MYASRTRAALTAVGATLTVLGGLTAAVAAPAEAAAAPCHAADLDISKGRLDAAASQRYLNIRIKNITHASCRLTGYPSFTFLRDGGTIGWGSVPEPGQEVASVRLEAGDSAWTTLHWTDPGPVPAEQCAEKQATGVKMLLPARPHVYRIVLDADVCTTKAYRPHAFPVRDSREY